MENKKVAPKPTIKKVAPLAKKSKVELVSYSIEMTIPTGAYANIKPSIVVKGGSIEEAHDFIAPHMNKLWKEYFMVNERRQEIVKPPMPSSVTNVPVAPITGGGSGSGPVGKLTSAPMSATEIATATGGTVMGEGLKPETVSAVPSPESSVALIKATQAIQSCVSLEALELIQNQVVKSVKLSHEDKESLMPLLEKKAIDLTFPEDEKRGK